MSAKEEDFVIRFSVSLSKTRCPACNAYNRLTLVSDEPIVIWCINCKTYHFVYIAYKEVKPIGELERR